MRTPTVIGSFITLLVAGAPAIMAQSPDSKAAFVLAKRDSGLAGYRAVSRIFDGPTRISFASNDQRMAFVSIAMRIDDDVVKLWRAARDMSMIQIQSAINEMNDKYRKEARAMLPSDQQLIFDRNLAALKSAPVPR